MVTKFNKNEKLAVFVAYIIGYLGLQVIIGLYLALIEGVTTQDELLAYSPMITFITGLATFVALVVIARKQLLDGVKQMSKKTWAVVGIGVVSLYAVNLGVGLALQLFGVTEEAANQLALESMIFEQPLLMMLPIAFLIPVLEEILFRGVILEFIERYWGVWASIIVSGFVFGLLHAQNIHVIQYSMMGMVLGYMYIKSGKNLIVPIIAHVFNNSFAFLMLYLAQNLM